MAKIGVGTGAAGKGGGRGGTRKSAVQKAKAEGLAKPPQEQCFARCVRCGRKFPVPGNSYCSECESELNEAG